MSSAMEVDSPAPAASAATTGKGKEVAKNSDKQRFEVKKVSSHDDAVVLS
jgi:hypothetical protein